MSLKYFSRNDLGHDLDGSRVVGWTDWSRLKAPAGLRRQVLLFKSAGPGSKAPSCAGYVSLHSNLHISFCSSMLKEGDQSGPMK